MFDHDRFLVDGTMERGCKPLLTIQFAPSSKEQENLWDGTPVSSMRVENNSEDVESKFIRTNEYLIV